MIYRVDCNFRKSFDVHLYQALERGKTPYIDQKVLFCIFEMGKNDIASEVEARTLPDSGYLRAHTMDMVLTVLHSVGEIVHCGSFSLNVCHQ